MGILKLALKAWHKTTKGTKFQVKAETSFLIHSVVRGCCGACGNTQRLKPWLYPHTMEQVKDGISARALTLMQRNSLWFDFFLYGTVKDKNKPKSISESF